MLECAELGNEVVFGNAVKKNLVCTEIHVSSRVWLLSAYSGARNGRKPAQFLSDWERQEDVFFCFEQEVTSGG